MPSSIWVGIFEGHWDPAAAIVCDGKLLAYAEEERFIRLKHAPRHYPTRALKFCLDHVGIRPRDVAAIGVNWNCPAYGNGEMSAFFKDLNRRWPVDTATQSWQRCCLATFNPGAARDRHGTHWRRLFGDVTVPPLHPIPHHFTHALHAFLQSPFEEALCLTLDGSGDQHCSVLWQCKGERIEPLREIRMPHSLGWYYAAFTEYLGFEAYDGEYKVMGLASYGRPNDELKQKVSSILFPAEDGIEYRLSPTYCHYGSHTWSDRFTDDLVELFGHPMRLSDDPMSQWHEDLAYAVQQALEEAACRLVSWGLSEMGTRNLCVGGGVALNVKMNSRLFGLDGVEGFFGQPLCSDGGAAAGAALGACWQATGHRPERLQSLALGCEEDDKSIRHTLEMCGIAYEEANDVAEIVAEELACGRTLGWFQGRMEAGPRALGQRSILADPRRPEMRDYINRIVKFREYWRPFCPSIPAEDARKYLKRYTAGEFMNISFEATDELRRVAPAVVHVDNTVRVQLVRRDVLPLFHRLLKAFGRRVGAPVLLNTSFNVKGDPIVCTFSDALRTFFSTGLDVLAAGNFVVRKNRKVPSS